MRSFFAVLVFALSLAGPVKAERATPTHADADADADATASPMEPFAWLIGEWRGTGWMIARDGVRSEFESVEKITPKLSGAALLVEGRHHLPGKPAAVVHDAMAILVWDSSRQHYRFRTALANGQNGDYPVAPTESGFVWTMETPQGEIRYTITLADGVWREEGVMTMANGHAVTFFQMELTKVE